MGIAETERLKMLESRAIETTGQMVPTHGGPMSYVERRDPVAATMQPRMAYTWAGLGMVADWNAEDAVRKAYLANVYVYRCIDAIAKAVSGCPFRAGRDLRKPQDFQEKSPLANLLGPPPGDPNPALSSRRLWYWTVVQRLTAGRWGWEMERSGSGLNAAVKRVWPLPACHLDPVPTKGGSEYFSKFVYGARTMNRRDLQTHQVLYDWVPSATDVRQAESPLQAARLDVSIAVMQDRYDYSFLRNNAVPAAVVVHEEFAVVGEREAFRNQFRGEFAGPDNAGKTYFVEATAGDGDVAKTFHVEQLGISQKDAMFIPRMEAKIQAICVTFGTPLSILGDSSARTFDNAGQEYTNWWEGTILPLQAEMCEAVNSQLAPSLGRDLGWFGTDHVAALNRPNPFWTMVAGSLPALVDAGIITKNEVRAQLKLEPLEDVQSADPTAKPVDEPTAPPAPALPPGAKPPAAATNGNGNGKVPALPALPAPAGREADFEDFDVNVDEIVKRWSEVKVLSDNGTHVVLERT